MAPYYAALAPFILDVFEYVHEDGSSTRTSKQVIGGAGTYAAIGARIWLAPDQVAMIVNRGHDFPSNVQTALDSYGPCWEYIDNPSRETAKGLNTYKRELRTFTYLTPKIPLNPTDLLGTRLYDSEWLHVVAPPDRTVEILSQLPLKGWMPKIVWEPFPSYCTPENWPFFEQVFPKLDILSPNYEEAASMCGVSCEEDVIIQDTLDFIVKKLSEAGCRKYIVIRCGAHGAFVVDVARQESVHVRAYHGGKSAHKVVDVTGAGNAFIGGMIAGMKLSNGDIFQATRYANVSASYVIEQEGLPTLEIIDGQETWNKDIVDTPTRRLTRII